MQLNRTVQEVWSIKLEVESLDDHMLIDELLYVCDDDSLDEISLNYFDNGELTEKEREQLVAYYILYFCNEVLIVD